MNYFLENYLNLLNSNNMDEFLKSFKKVIIYYDPKEIEMGLLKYKKPPEDGIAFLFELPTEEIAHFHTIGMKFKIDILFYDQNKKLDSYYLDIEPGVNLIKSKNKVKYVIEIPNEESK